MVISLSYQHLYDFSREWSFPLKDELSLDDFLSVSSEENVDYWQKGALSAIGLAYSVKPFKSWKEFSCGVTLNFWSDNFNNEWEENFHREGFEEPPPLTESADIPMEEFFPPDEEIPLDYQRTDNYSFNNGFNANIGMLWNKRNFFQKRDQLKIGAVFKLPFRGDLEHKRVEKQLINGDIETTVDKMTEETLDMPMSYGIGLAYRFPNNIWIAADIYRTEWQDFILNSKEDGEISPITGKSLDESNIKATTQFRFGLEYRTDSKSPYVYSGRMGFFYDPAPTKGGYDEYYGISTGFGVNKRTFAFDIAYQLRFGNDIGTSIAPYYSLSQNVREHTVYASFIFYLNNFF